MKDKACADVTEPTAPAASPKGHRFPTWHVLMAQKFGCQPESFWKLWRLGLIRRRPDNTYYVPLDDLSAYVENSALLPGTKLDSSLHYISETQAHYRAVERMRPVCPQRRG
jgi:hypothetical protein